jgi:hypothetical protein
VSVLALAPNRVACWVYTHHWAAWFPELLGTFGSQAFVTHWDCPGAEEHLEV